MLRKRFGRLSRRKMIGIVVIILALLSLGGWFTSTFWSVQVRQHHPGIGMKRNQNITNDQVTKNLPVQTEPEKEPEEEESQQHKEEEESQQHKEEEEVKQQQKEDEKAQKEKEEQQQKEKEEVQRQKQEVEPVQDRGSVVDYTVKDAQGCRLTSFHPKDDNFEMFVLPHYQPPRYVSYHENTFYTGTCENRHHSIRDTLRKVSHHYLSGMAVSPSLVEGCAKKNILLPKSRKADHQTELLQALHDFHSFMEQHNIIYTVQGGFLIGLCRTNRPIFWDHDLDVYASSKGHSIFHEMIPKVYNRKTQPSLYWRKVEVNGRFYAIKRVHYHTKRIREHFQWISMEFCKREVLEKLKDKNMTDWPSDCWKHSPPPPCGILPYLDVWFCRKKKCEIKKENGFSRYKKKGPECRKWKAHICDDVKWWDQYHRNKGKALYNISNAPKEGYLCQIQNGLCDFNFGFGPYPEHGKEDFPVVEVCGFKTRVPRLFLEDRKLACKYWAEYDWKSEVKLRAHKSMKFSLWRNRNDKSLYPLKFAKLCENDQVYKKRTIPFVRKRLN